MKAMYMEKTQSWRVLLKEQISSQQERRRIAQVLEVNAMTLVRWATGQSDPRQENLFALLETLPEKRQAMLASIKQEFPQFFIGNASITNDAVIPSAFYDRILYTYAITLPLQRAFHLAGAIAQQIFTLFSTSIEDLAVVIAYCIQCDPKQPVRSLRRDIEYSSSNWERFSRGQMLLFGIESPLGRAVAKGRIQVINNQQERKAEYPLYLQPYPGVESELACPIMLSDQIAGCLYLASSRPDHFTPDYQKLIQRYVTLLSVITDAQAFGKHSDIRLGFMPTPRQQIEVLVHFHERANKLVTDAGHTMSRPQADLLIWQQMEDELFKLPAIVEE